MNRLRHGVFSPAALVLLLLFVAHQAETGPIQFVNGPIDQEGPDWFSRATEPSIAVGPFQIFTQLQGNVRIFEKDGDFVFDSGPHLFYGITDSYTQPTYQIDQPAPLGSLAAKDPICAFDAIAQRYYALVFSDLPDAPASGHLHLCVSRSNNLDDGWHVYHIAGAVDRPVLGYNNNKIVITSSWGFNGHSARVFNKLALLNNTVAVVAHQGAYDYGVHYDISSDFYDVDVPGHAGGFRRICRNLSSTNELYFVGLAGTQLQVQRMSGSTWDVATFPEPTASVTVPYRSPVQAKQKDLGAQGGFSYLWSGDEPSEPWYCNGRITIARHQADLSHTLNELQLLQAVVTDMNNVTVESEFYGVPGLYVGFPTAIADEQNNIYVGFNTSSATTYPSCYITARKAGESSIESPPVLVRPGEVPSSMIRYPDFPSLGYAWGDFTSIALDVCSATSPVAYYVGQYMKDSPPGTQDHTPGWIKSFHFPASPPSACGDPASWQFMTSSSAPSPRWDATFTWDANLNRFIMFGGFDGTNYLNDTWIYEPAANSWWQLTPSGGPPGARRRHSAIFDPTRNRLVIFGGENATTRLNTTWALSLAGAGTWTSIFPSGGPPSGRCSHVAIYDPVRDQMVIQGGIPWTGAHTWKLSFAQNQWSQIVTSSSPLAVEAASAIYDPLAQRMLVFGGRTYFGGACPAPWLQDLNETWSLDLTTATNWVQLFPSGTTPARAFASAAYDGGCQRMLVFGGIQDQVCDSPCGQALELGMTSASALSLTGPLAWTDVNDGCYEPWRRGHHGGGYSNTGNAFFAFGGGERAPIGATCPFTYRNDVWRIQLPDHGAPGTVTNLSATLSKFNGILNWTAPGDDETIGRAVQYDLRRSLNLITEQNFASATPISTPQPNGAGAMECADVPNLAACTWYYFALKSRDEAGNWSPLSTVLHAKTQCKLELEISCGAGKQTAQGQEEGVEPEPQRVALSVPSQRSDGMQITFEIPQAENGAALELSVFDLLGRRVRTVLKSEAEPGVHEETWDLTDSEGVRVGRGIYFIRLRVGREELGQRVLVMG